MRYHAFLSHSHRDQDLAEQLERALQRFAKPWHKPRARRVFRDASNLPPGPLPGSIAKALRESKFFLFLASPAAAASEWATREIDTWLAERPADGRERILLVLADGAIEWDDEANDFDWQRTSALPRRCSEVFDEEPLYVDLRTVGSGFESAAFNQAIATLVAAVEERPLEDMRGEEYTQHRRTMHARNAAIGALSVLLVLAVGFAGFAVYQRGIALEQRDEANRQRDRALARQLAVDSRLALAESGRSAVRSGLLALESLARDRTPAGFDAWQTVMDILPTRVADLDVYRAHAQDLRFTASGRLLAIGERGAVLLDVEANDVLARAPHRGRAARTHHRTWAFDADSHRLALVHDNVVTLYDAQSLAPIGETPVLHRAATGLALSPDGVWLAAIFNKPPHLLVWRDARLDTPVFTSDGRIMSVDYSPDSKWLVAGAAGAGGIELWELATASMSRPGAPDGEPAWGPAKFSPSDGSLVNWQGYRWQGRSWRLQAKRLDPSNYRAPMMFSARRWLHLGSSVWRVRDWTRKLDNIDRAVFSSDELHLAHIRRQHVVLHDLDGGAEPSTLNHADVTYAQFSPDGKVLATADDKGTVKIWGSATGERTATMSFPGPITALQFSTNATQIAATVRGAGIQVWEVTPQAAGRLPPAVVGHRLVTRRNGVQVVDVTTGKPLLEVQAAPNLEDVLISRDGRWLAVKRDRQRWQNTATRLWDLSADTQSRELGGAPAGFSPDSRKLLTYAIREGAVNYTVVDTATLAPVGTWLESAFDYDQQSASVTPIAYSQDGARLALGVGIRSRDRRYLPIAGHARVLRAGDWGELLTVAHDSPVEAVALSYDGRLLGVARASPDAALEIWSVDEQKRIAQLPYIGNVRFSRDGTRIAQRGQAVVGVWAIPSGSKLAEFRLPGKGEGGLSMRNVPLDRKTPGWGFAPAGDRLAAGTDGGEIIVWDIATRKQLATIFHGGRIEHIAFDASGARLRTVARDGAVRSWDAQTGAPVREIPHHALAPSARELARRHLLRVGHNADRALPRYAINEAATSPDTHWLAVAGDDHVVLLWDMRTGAFAARLSHPDPVLYLRFSADGQWLASASTRHICIWAVPGWQQSSCHAVKTRVEGLALSSTGAWVAARSDKNVRFWRKHNPHDATTIRHEGKVTAITFDAAGARLATLTDKGELGVLYTATGNLQLRATLDENGFNAAFSANGRWLAVQTAQDVRVRTMASGAEIARWRVDDVRDVRFGPDDATLRIATRDADLALPWATEAIVTSTCKRLARNLTYDEWQTYLAGQPYPRTCMTHPVHPSLRAEAEALIKGGDFERAVSLFETILAFDDTSTDTPLADTARRHAAPALVVRAGDLARRGQIDGAIDAIDEARRMHPAIEISARAHNTLCWFGSLWNKSARVINHCTAAVNLEQDDARFKDSRGLARALTGDTPGAIADFEAYIANAPVSEEKKTARKEWITVLRDQQQPFTAERLEALRGMPPDKGVMF